MNNNNFKSCLYHILKKDAGISTELADEIVEDKTDILVRSFIKDIVGDSVIFLDELNGTDSDGGVVGELGEPGTYIDIDQKSEPKFKVGDKITLVNVPKYPAKEIIAIQNDAYYFDMFEHLPFSHQDEWKLVDQNPVWSEEDEHRAKDAIYFLETAKKHYAGTTELDACIIWLKYLKDRYARKPSNDQMESLLYEVNAWGEDSVNGQNLKSLYQDLKKLKED